MSRSLLGNGAPIDTTSAASGVRFLAATGHDNSGIYATAALAQQRWIGGPGKIRALEVCVVTNGRPNSTTFAFILNGSPTGLAFAVPGSSAGSFGDLFSEVTIDTGDLFCIRATNGITTATGMRLSGFQFEFKSDADNTITQYCGTCDVSVGTNGETYTGLMGTSSVGLAVITLAGIRPQISTPGTIARISVQVDTNTYSAASCTVTMQKNGVDTALAVTFGPGVTGFLDAVANVAVAQGDEICFKLKGSAVGGTGVCNVKWIAARFESATTGFDRGTWDADNLGAISSSVPTYYRWFGRTRDGYANESDISFPMPHGYKVALVAVSIVGNDISTGVFDIRSRRAGANGNIQITIPQATDGVFKDNTHFDNLIAANDSGLVASPVPTDTNVHIRWIMAAFDGELQAKPAVGHMLLTTAAPTVQTGALRRRLGRMLKALGHA